VDVSSAVQSRQKSRKVAQPNLWYGFSNEAKGYFSFRVHFVKVGCPALSDEPHTDAMRDLNFASCDVRLTDALQRRTCNRRRAASLK
jgi:hypothetical protein